MDLSVKFFDKKFISLNFWFTLQISLQVSEIFHLTDRLQEAGRRGGGRVRSSHHPDSGGQQEEVHNRLVTSPSHGHSTVLQILRLCTADIPSEDILLSPTSKSSRSDSRSSFDMSPLEPAGSFDSLEGGGSSVARRSSWGSVTLSGLSYPSCDRLIETGDPSERINPQPCVPSVVTTCIK